MTVAIAVSDSLRPMAFHSRAHARYCRTWLSILQIKCNLKGHCENWHSFCWHLARR